MGSPQKKVAIIGAGPSSLALMRAFSLAEAEGVRIPEIICFEKQSDWGGMWNYTWKTGIDDKGEPIHGAMYRNMWTNSPKECCELDDISFDQHFQKPVTSFLERKDYRSYIISRAEKSNIRRFIQFNTVVRFVELGQDKRFTVRVQNLVDGTMIVDHFDYVVVATGHYTTPNLPHFEGVEQFPGRVLHSQDLREAGQFTGQNVLLIGSSDSAEDIALQCYKYKAKSVTISYRTKPLGFKWPNNIKEVPLLLRLEGKTAHFKDGSSKDFDTIIFCTGFKHNFPFLTNDLRLVTTNRAYPGQLYKCVLFQEQPNLIYLAMQCFITLPLYDVQGWYVRDVILDRIPLPDVAERAKDVKKWVDREIGVETKADHVDFYADYMNDLMSYTDCPKYDMEKIALLFKAWANSKNNDIMSYRDQAYSTWRTGSKAASMGSWFEAGL